MESRVGDATRKVGLVTGRKTSPGALTKDVNRITSLAIVVLRRVRERPKIRPISRPIRGVSSLAGTGPDGYPAGRAEAPPTAVA